MPLQAKLRSLDHEIAQLNIATRDLQNLVKGMESRVISLEGGEPNEKMVKMEKEEKEEKEDPEKVRITTKNIKEYVDKMCKHPTIAKTSVLFDIMPCDSETDLEEMLEKVREIKMAGLLWGSSRRLPVGFGIDKMQLMCTVEDDKVSIEELCEKMEAFKDLVQSAEVSVMNKI